MWARLCTWMLFLLLALAAGDDWPQWRGTHRDGAVSDSSAPAYWPEHLQVRWKLTVGEGHSSPILAGGRIFVFSRQSGKEVVSAIEPSSGRILWQESYPAPYTMNPAATRHGEGPKSTPVVYDGRVYTLGISGILTCWDAATGAVRWRKEFSKAYHQTSPLFGSAMSPVVDQGLLIVHVGGHDDGALTAFDAGSGEIKWQWAGDGPAYASPVVAELSGTRQVITETQTNIVGVSAATGQLLWKIPFTTQYVQNIPTPLLYRDTVILSGLDKGVFAVRPAVKGGRWTADTVWRNSGVSLYMSSPVLNGDLVFGFSHFKKGQFFCLDAGTGASRWTGPPRQGDNAAILTAGGNLIWLKDGGELVVAKADGMSYEPVRTYTVADSPTWAHPLVLRNGVVIKDATTLAFWSTK